MVDRDPSVFHEPWYRPDSAPGESVSDEPALGAPQPPMADREAAEQSVWDEPQQAYSVTPPPPDALTYSRWYEARAARTSAVTSWAVTALLALFGGIFGLLGTFLQGLGSDGFLYGVLVAPAVEEVAKIGLVAVVCENRPYLFRSSAQIAIAAVASALTFATVENLLYIHVYVEDPTAFFIQWRWVVCTGLHVTATSLASLGVIWMWRRSRRDSQGAPRFAKPVLSHAFPFIAAAITVHALYNLTATFLDLLLPF